MPAMHQGHSVLQLPITQGGAGALDLVAAPAAGEFIYVTHIVVTLTAAGTLKFTEGTGPTDLTGTMGIAANSGFVAVGDTENPVLWTKTAASKLSLVSVTGAAAGWFAYFLSKDKP